MVELARSCTAQKGSRTSKVLRCVHTSLPQWDREWIRWGLKMQAHKATLHRPSSYHSQLKQQGTPRAQGAAPCTSGNPTQIIRTRKQAHIRLLHPEHTPSAQVTHRAPHIPAPTSTRLPKLFNTQSTQKLLFHTEKDTYSIQLTVIST